MRAVPWWVWVSAPPMGLGAWAPMVPGWRRRRALWVAAGALAQLPGIDDALATRIIELRAELNGFSSVHELGDMLDLDGHAVERLLECVVFLPR